jgi:hypothetical protein
MLRRCRPRRRNRDRTGFSRLVSRYDITLRMTGAFGRTEAFVNGVLLAFLRPLLGDDMQLSNFTIVAAHSGASEQHVHRDCRPWPPDLLAQPHTRIPSAARLDVWGPHSWPTSSPALSAAKIKYRNGENIITGGITRFCRRSSFSINF